MTATLPVVPAVRFHLSLNVSDLERSIAFYGVLFGRGPAKRTDLRTGDVVLAIAGEDVSDLGHGERRG